MSDTKTRGWTNGPDSHELYVDAMESMNTANPNHPHGPPEPRFITDDGRCLLCKILSLERELAAERESQFKWKSAALSTALYRADCEVSTPDDYQRHQAEASCALIQRAEQAEARLAEAMSALDAAGCPIGNEHKTYSIVERIAGLHKTRDYAWKQMDEGRAWLAEATEIIKLAVPKLECLPNNCAHCRGFEFLNSAEPPALLKEVEGLRRQVEMDAECIERIQRHGQADEAKLNIAREALEKIASWSEGQTVRSHFDEPASALVAREAITKIQ